jgi:hypothetical protein
MPSKNDPVETIEGYESRISDLQSTVRSVEDNTWSGMADAAYRDTEFAAFVESIDGNYQAAQQYLALNDGNTRHMLDRMCGFDDRLRIIRREITDLRSKISESSADDIYRRLDPLGDELRKLEEEVAGYVPRGEQVALSGRIAGTFLPDIRGPLGHWTNPTGDPYYDDASPFDDF